MDVLKVMACIIVGSIILGALMWGVVEWIEWRDQKKDKRLE